MQLLRAMALGNNLRRERHQLEASQQAELMEIHIRHRAEMKDLETREAAVNKLIAKESRRSSSSSGRHATTRSNSHTNASSAPTTASGTAPAPAPALSMAAEAGKYTVVDMLPPALLAQSNAPANSVRLSAKQLTTYVAVVLKRTDKKFLSENPVLIKLLPHAGPKGPKGSDGDHSESDNNGAANEGVRDEPVGVEFPCAVGRIDNTYAHFAIDDLFVSTEHARVNLHPMLAGPRNPWLDTPRYCHWSWTASMLLRQLVAEMCQLQC